ncbi:DoxX family protein [Sphingobacterium oryzagri]|uniref:DoxX family protein n=1 Tax=Sphingobacterium oryzagri TaxID=3025669 RepID=A0ABY7WI17_9SPHI|nr:DoxX family protein [Sphingobacterium sp. KACC 22765]WDF67930.1 DoxX family protein [Sphingobacterium sp. KACC 22765]
MDKNKISFFFLRLPIAVSLLGHGMVRLPKLAAFSAWMLDTMEKSFLPQGLILPFSFALPILEFIIGIALLFRAGIQYSIYAGLLLMTVLIFGSCSIENWAAIEAQLLHAIYLFGLLLYAQHIDRPSPAKMGY